MNRDNPSDGPAAHLAVITPWNSGGIPALPISAIARARRCQSRTNVCARGWNNMALARYPALVDDGTGNAIASASRAVGVKSLSRKDNAQSRAGCAHPISIHRG